MLKTFLLKKRIHWISKYINNLLFVQAVTGQKCVFLIRWRVSRNITATLDFLIIMKTLLFYLNDLTENTQWTLGIRCTQRSYYLQWANGQFLAADSGKLAVFVCPWLHVCDDFPYWILKVLYIGLVVLLGLVGLLRSSRSCRSCKSFMSCRFCLSKIKFIQNKTLV